MAYDERVEAGRRKVIDGARKQGGEKLVDAVKGGVEVEVELADLIRDIVTKTVNEAEGDPMAAIIVRLAVTEALSTVYAEAAVEAFHASDTYNKRKSTEATMTATAVASTLNNFKLAYDNYQTAKSGVEDMIASAKA